VCIIVFFFYQTSHIRTSSYFQQHTHLADSFIQSNLHCISKYTFLSVLAFPRNQTNDIGVASTKALMFELEENIYKFLFF